jgi:putative ABC transport system permease protein
MSWLRIVPHHLRHAVRLMLRHPGSSWLAILALASGIALTVTMFSLVHGLLLRGLPFVDADRYIYVASTDREQNLPTFRMSAHDYVDMRDAQSSFASFVAFLYRTVNLSDDADFPERRNGCFATHQFFASPSFEPQLGRVFGPEDDRPGETLVAVIGHGLWQQRFRGDPGVLGRRIRVDGEQAEIVGVMPAGFRFPLREEIWLPLRLDVERKERSEGEALRVFGRLRPGIGLAQARSELEGIAGRLARDHPEVNDGRGVELRPYTRQFMFPAFRQALWALLALVVLGLLIACANVASLLMVRAVSRLRELATFSALGASRLQVMGYVMSESLLLSALGAAGGLVLASLGVDFVARQMARIDMPFWMSVTLDAWGLGFAVALTVLAAHVAGFYPAYRASRADFKSLLHDSRTTSGLSVGRFVRFLVVAEVGVAGLLLACGGLFLRSLVNLDGLDLGIDVEQVYTARLALPQADYPQAADRTAFVDELAASLNARSAVAAAAAATSLPASGFGVTTFYSVEGAVYPSPAEHPRTHRIAVTPEFFDVFALPALRGRTIEARDRADSLPVAVVNRSFAERSWPSEDALGKRVRLGREEADGPWLTVVGVVADLWPGTLDESDQSGVYVAHAQSGDPAVLLAVSARGDAGQLADLLRRETRALDDRLPLFEMGTFGGVLEVETFQSLLFARIMGALGLLALFFAAVGIYGVNAFAVHQRTSEIGIRMAMGAERKEIVGLIVRQGMSRVAAGLAIGLGSAVVLAPFLELVLFGVAPRDPATLLAAAGFLAAVSFVASFVPAARAARIDPISAVHYE